MTEQSYSQIQGRITSSPRFREIVERGRAERAVHFGEPTDANGKYTDPPGWHPYQEPFHGYCIKPSGIR